MKFKKFAAVILMSVMIGSMSLSGCGINKNATAVTMTGDAIDTIEVDMGYANFAARIQQASYERYLCFLIMERITGRMSLMQRMERICRILSRTVLWRTLRHSVC